MARIWKTSPFWHVSQLERGPFEVDDFPIWHASHVLSEVAPRVLEDFPLAHSVQLDIPSWRVASDPSSTRYDPAAQSVQDVEVVLLLYFPEQKLVG